MVLPPEATSFDADAFDELIRAHGVEAIHYRSLRCPVGMTDPDDTMRRPHEHHANCSNGFLYSAAGTLHCSFLGNSKESTFNDFGRTDGSTVQATFSRFYDDRPDKRIQMCQYDRVYLKDESVTVVDWHTFACSATGIDRLQFPAVDVEVLVDAHDKVYTLGVDFSISNGQIKWANGQGPGLDPKTGKGVVCSIRYSYRPFWYVERMIHEVRVAQIEDDYGNRSVERMPQQAQLKREVWFEKEQRDAEVADTNKRQKPGPANGTFGPR